MDTNCAIIKTALGGRLNRIERGFTLAEVLITLTIIGVVAAMTIPTLVNKYQERATVVALKKAYSTLSQAYLMAVQENGTPENWDWSSVDNLNMMFSKYLRTTKDCPAGSDCAVDENNLYRINGDPYGNGALPGSLLSDGSLVRLSTMAVGCDSVRGPSQALQSVCGEIIVVLPPIKKKVTMGVNRFSFFVTKFGLIPRGTAPQEDAVNTGYKFSNDCLKGSTFGFSCTAWVLENQNMDYLRCSDLSWDGKRKCD